MNTSKRRPVRVAIIGLGWWGQKMVSILKSCGTELEIVCAVELNPAAGDFCANNGLTLAASYDAALARADVDAVILATPLIRYTRSKSTAALPRASTFSARSRWL